MPEDRSPRGRFLISSRNKRLDPRLPDLMVKDMPSIDFAGLAERGIVNYCFDLDNTLVSQRGEEPTPEVLAALTRARESGWIKNLCVISNTLWGRRKERRALRVARRMGIEMVFCCDFVTRKPSSIPFYWALQSMGCLPEQTAMVGDQIYSDIVGGNRVGMFTILLTPFSPDHWSTRLVGRRLREAWFLRAYGLQRPT